MIRYVGGKTRLAKPIANVLKEHVSKHTLYSEPFVGGNSMSKYTSAFGLLRILSDSNKNLIDLYKEIQAGWTPPEYVSENTYKELKYADDSPLRTYVGYACSFGGKWFGGYARVSTGRRDMTHESYVRVMKSRDYIKDAIFLHSDYRSCSIDSRHLVYCDPPYEGTLGYNTKFNHTDFWNTIRCWVDMGATVLVSGYQAPNDFVDVWSKEYSTYIHHKPTNNKKIEKLFMHKDYLNGK